jgi:hypothetical protein
MIYNIFYGQFIFKCVTVELKKYELIKILKMNDKEIKSWVSMIKYIKYKYKNILGIICDVNYFWNVK